MRAKVERLLIAIFLFGSIAVFVWSTSTRPRILVLQSYDPSYSWTRDVTLGVERILGTHKSLQIRWHYMDLKRYPWPEFKESAGIRARRAIEDYAPDVLIAIDDDAQQYAARFFTGHHKTKIVFAGINGEVAPYGYDKAANVTGILERKQLPALKQAINDATFGGKRPGPLRLYLLGDSSDSVTADLAYFRDFNWAPHVVAAVKQVKTLDEWHAAIREASTMADLIVTTNYRKISRSTTDKKLVSPSEIVAWSEANSTIPLVGTNGFFVEDGGMMAIGTSGYEQGEVAAHMALDIIEKGIAPTKIPVTETSLFMVYLRPHLVASRHVDLPPIYDAFARATNNYYE